jgi:hypothetical protein
MNDLESNRPTDGAPLAWRRMTRHRNRRRKGVRCITIELRETEIDLLIRRGRLARDSRADLAAVGKALHGFLMIICGDAQQRPSDASQIPLSPPHFGRLPACTLPDHRDISEAYSAPSSVAAPRYRQKAGAG